MLRHIVMITYKSEATDAQRSAMQATVANFANVTPGLRSLVAGNNIGKGPNHHDYAIVADFDDVAAFRAYIDSEAHADYVENHARKIVAKLAAIQHEM